MAFLLLSPMVSGIVSLLRRPFKVSWLDNTINLVQQSALPQAADFFTDKINGYPVNL
jgi:hypothetical protein